jgi:Na+(H+)/acetate symporter ActP
VYVFYLFSPAPLHWNEANLVTARALDPSTVTADLEQEHRALTAQRKAFVLDLVAAQRAGDAAQATLAHDRIEDLEARDTQLKARFTERLTELEPDAETNDKDYIFITWVMDHLPVGVVGLLLAMIFCAGMGSTSSQLSALATTAVVDIFRSERTGQAQVTATKWATVAFGILALLFAAIFPLFDNLIQAVNILGSLFYGTILGIFLVAFFLKHVQGTAVFVAGLVTQGLTFIHYALDQWNVFATAGPDGVVHDPLALAFLWYNLLAPAVVILLAVLLQHFASSPPTAKAEYISTRPD